MECCFLHYKYLHRIGGLLVKRRPRNTHVFSVSAVPSQRSDLLISGAGCTLHRGRDCFPVFIGPMTTITTKSYHCFCRPPLRRGKRTWRVQYWIVASFDQHARRSEADFDDVPVVVRYSEEIGRKGFILAYIQGPLCQRASGFGKWFVHTRTWRKPVFSSP